MEPVCIHKKTAYPYKKTYFFVIEKYIEDVKQDKKHVPDLLEAIIQPPGLVKEELRPMLFKIDQFGSKITKINVFLDPANPKFSRRRPTQPSRPVGSKQ